MQEPISNPAFHYYFSALPQPALADTRLKDRDRRLLAAFYLIAGRGNIVYNKTREDLGKLARMAKNVVSTTSARLVEFGWLKKSGTGGRGHSALYELTIPEAFTHLQRSTSSICRTNTTQQRTAPVTSEKKPIAQTRVTPREKLIIPSSAPSPFAQDKRYSLSSSLDYPNGLNPSFANSLLIHLPENEQQVALDEWLGQVTSYKERAIPIHSPNGLFRSIIRSLLAGHTAQHATHVKQRRERATLITKAIERSTQRTHEVTEPSPSSAKRFAPGELKAKLMADVLKLKQEATPSQPVTPVDKTRHTSRQLKEENPSHFMTASLYITTQPTKNIKPTTTVPNQANQEKVDEASKNRGGSDLKHHPDSSTNHSVQTKEQLEGVGSLADDQTQLCSTQTEWTSSCGFIEEPSVQSPGRGQLTSCPPQLLSSTSSTRPDALRLPKYINIFSNTQKTIYAEKTSVHNKEFQSFLDRQAYNSKRIIS